MQFLRSLEKTNLWKHLLYRWDNHRVWSW